MKAAKLLRKRNLLPSCRIPRTVLDNLSGMSVESDRRGQDQIEWICDREQDDHLPRHKFRFDLVRDPQRGH